MLIIAPGQEAKLGSFSLFFNMKVYCVFSLESPHRSKNYKESSTDDLRLTLIFLNLVSGAFVWENA